MWHPLIHIYRPAPTAWPSLCIIVYGMFSIRSKAHGVFRACCAYTQLGVLGLRKVCGSNAYAHRSDAARHGCASDRLHEGCVLVIDRVAPQAGSRGLCRKHTCHWWPGSKVRSHAQFAPGWRIPHISAWSCPTGCVQGCARSISIKSPRSGRPYTAEYHSIGLDFDTARVTTITSICDRWTAASSR